MKNIVIYSSDSNICLSLLMYFQNDYSVTTTTNLGVLKAIDKNLKMDLVIIDAEPSKSIEDVCKLLKEKNPEISIIVTYVYENNSKSFDTNIRKYANSIFYKPFDLSEVTSQLSALLV